ncbi:MAG: ABC transporter ATP-binding protein [Alphaproteobacteria bacterium]
MSDSLLKVENVSVEFKVPIGGGIFQKMGKLRAVRDVSFDLKAGETLGIVGESGCGKSTLGRAVLQLLHGYKGTVTFEGRNLKELSKPELRDMRKDMQIIFQDPLASLNPRMTIGQTIAEPLKSFAPHLSKAERTERVLELMSEVGLLPEMLNRYPHEFSGGQAQRIGIARALISEPKLIICDEPVSALDVSIQAQIINLLQDLQKKRNLALIFISHDLSVVYHISTNIAVLYLGKVIEYADKEELYNNSKHPYSRSLLSAVPVPDPELAKKRRRIKLEGELPSPINPPSGCAFRTRCAYATDLCTKEAPLLDEASPHHQVACFHWNEL